MRTIDVLRKIFPGQWTYHLASGVWASPEQGLRAHHVHTGGYDYAGEALPGSTIYVYGLPNTGGRPLWMVAEERGHAHLMHIELKGL